MQLSNGLQGTLLPVRANLDDFSVFSIGMLGSAFHGGLVLGCFICPWMVKRVGHIRAFTAFAAIASIAALIHMIIVSEIVWWLARAFTGICFAGMQIVIESWLNERATNKTRGTILSIYTLVNLVLIIAGQQLMNVADPNGVLLFTLASIILSLSVIPVALTTSPSPSPITRIRLRLKWIYSISPAGVIGAIGVGLANGAFWGMGALYAQKIGLSIQQIALFMSVAVIGGALFQWPLGWLSDRIDRRIIIIVSCMGASISAVLIATGVFYDVQMLFILVAIFGGFSLPMYALCLAHANDHVDAIDTLEVSGGLLLLYAVGATLGPFIASSLMELTTPGFLFIFTMLIHASIAALIFWRVRISEPIAYAEKDSFVALPETLPAINELDPRA